MNTQELSSVYSQPISKQSSVSSSMRRQKGFDRFVDDQFQVDITSVGRSTSTTTTVTAATGTAEQTPANHETEVGDETNNSCETRKNQKRINIFAPKHRKNLARFLSYSLQNKQLVFWGNLGLLITSVAQISLPYLAGRMIDVISQEDSSQQQLNYLALTFLIACIASSIFTFIRGYCFDLLGERVMLALRNDLFKSFLSKDIEFYDKNKSGELISRISSDTATIQTAASDKHSMFIRNILQFIGSFAILCTISYELTLILFVIVPPLIIGVAMFVSRLKKYSKLYQDRLSDGNSLANEAFGNIRVVKSFAREKQESLNFLRHMTEAYDFGKVRSVLHGSFLGFFTLLGEGALLCVVYYGGSMVLEGEISTGQLSSFLLYTITLSVGLVSAGSDSTQIITAIAVSEKLFDMMDISITVTSGDKTKESLDGNIRLENVTFEYPTKPNVEVLKNINLEVKQGQVVAFVGSSGSGKSSTVSLVERFYDVKSGSVAIDGVDIREYDLQWLREQIGYVSQEPTLFSGSLRDNVTYGVKSFSKQDIDKALEMANAKDFVYDKSVFPEGLDTLVGERGVKLSGGQKQRIAIARALIKNPKILIFDEATSALDAESEFQVQQAIDNLTAHSNRTIILIAHRLSTIRNADAIVVFQQGEIKEIGTHNQLLSIHDGFYAKLIARQIHSDESDGSSDSTAINNGIAKQLAS